MWIRPSSEAPSFTFVYRWFSITDLDRFSRFSGVAIACNGQNFGGKNGLFLNLFVAMLIHVLSPGRILGPRVDSLLVAGVLSIAF